WLSTSLLLPFLHPPNLREAGVAYDPEHMLIQQSLGPLAFLPMLLCLVTMRARNGYAGLHDMVTRTRVVKIRAASVGSKLDDVPILVPSALENPAAFGPFRVTGSLGRSGVTAILQARDATLNRLAWIFVQTQTGEGQVSTERAGVMR